MRTEDALKTLAYEVGFSRCGIAAIPDDGRAPDADFLVAWIESGSAGPMAYMRNSIETRLNIKTRFPWARSMLCVGTFYDGRALGTPGVDLIAHVARYARGRDYHKVFERRLKRLANHAVAVGLCTQAHWYVDTGPVLERGWAQRAGLGWTGKNACLISPQGGSFLLLGELILDVALQADVPLANHCGSCNRCIEACPTQALTSPGKLDARQCISTWNLEERGLVPEHRWTQHFGWAAGCDICQAVCPFNAVVRGQALLDGPARIPQYPSKTPVADDDLSEPLPWQQLTLAQSIMLTQADFERHFQGSALKRTGWKGLRLGAITAAANTKAGSTVKALQACLTDADDDIRARASWALRCVGAPVV